MHHGLDTVGKHSSNANPGLTLLHVAIAVRPFDRLSVLGNSAGTTVLQVPALLLLSILPTSWHGTAISHALNGPACEG